MTIEALNKSYKNDFSHLQIVTGEGFCKAKIMLIGEAPGKDEVKQGKPFVGKAGKNLSEFLHILNLKREDIYITNVVKFRPVKISKKNTVSNRPPAEAEIKLFLPYLLKEIEIINPQIIVTLGNTPLRALSGNVTVGQMHGKITEYNGKMLYPLYHPACIIYNPALKNVCLKDVQNLKSLLENFYKGQDL